MANCCCVIICHVLDYKNPSSYFPFVRFPNRQATVEDILGALEGEEEGVQAAKQHYHGSVAFVQRGVTHMALIFASLSVLSILEHDCTFTFADATFHTAPKPFLQVFNILVSYKSVVLPCFHIVMTSKLSGLYSAVFERIADHFPNFRPVYMNTDFEAGLIKAIRYNFPEAIIMGCRFHFAKAVFRAIMGPSKLTYKTFAVQALNFIGASLKFEISISLGYLVHHKLRNGFISRLGML